MDRKLPEIKAPYAVVTVLIWWPPACFSWPKGPSIPRPSRSAAVLIGGLVTGRPSQWPVGALNTAVLMVFSSFMLLGCAVVLLHADTFKDHAIEGGGGRCGHRRAHGCGPNARKA